MQIDSLSKRVAVLAAIAAAFPATAFSQKAAAPFSGAMTIYRQVMADGQILYSDKVAKGATVEHTIKVQPPIKGIPWAAEPAARPVLQPRPQPDPAKAVTPPSRQLLHVEREHFPGHA